MPNSKLWLLILAVLVCGSWPAGAAGEAEPLKAATKEGQFFYLIGQEGYSGFARLNPDGKTLVFSINNHTSKPMNFKSAVYAIVTTDRKPHSLEVKSIVNERAFGDKYVLDPDRPDGAFQVICYIPPSMAGADFYKSKRLKQSFIILKSKLQLRFGYQLTITEQLKNYFRKEK